MGGTSQPSASAGPRRPPAALLYDGRCRLCIASKDRILRLSRPGAVVAVDLHEPGALDRAPGLTHEQAMRSIHLVEPDGRVRRGLDAVVRAVASRGGIAGLALLYYLPIVRQAADLAYRLVARNRYRLFGRASPAEACGNGSCTVDGPRSS